MGVLSGQVVLITGAGGGIGRACALLAAQEGARVLVNDLGAGLSGGDPGSPAAAEATAAAIRGRPPRPRRRRRRSGGRAARPSPTPKA